jgi:hypothetical protein
MLLRRNRRGIAPEFGDELVLVHELISIEACLACLWPKDMIGRDVIARSGERDRHIGRPYIGIDHPIVNQALAAFFAS